MSVVLAKSEHFQCRQNQRGIRDEVVALAIQFGRCFREGDRKVFFLGRKQIPGQVRSQLRDKVNGTVVVMSNTGVLVSTYKNPDYIKALKKHMR
jgi:hypothetical protein